MALTAGCNAPSNLLWTLPLLESWKKSRNLQMERTADELFPGPVAETIVSPLTIKF